jgi:hypothetical protein
MLKEMANTPGKFNMRWEGPYTGKERKGYVNYKIYADTGKKMMIVHADRMKQFHKRKSPEETAEEIKQNKSIAENPKEVKQDEKKRKTSEISTK